MDGGEGQVSVTCSSEAAEQMPCFHLMNWYGVILCLSSWSFGISRPSDKSGLCPPGNRRVAFLGTGARSCLPLRPPLSSQGLVSTRLHPSWVCLGHGQHSGP